MNKIEGVKREKMPFGPVLCVVATVVSLLSLYIMEALPFSIIETPNQLTASHSVWQIGHLWLVGLVFGVTGGFALLFRAWVPFLICLFLTGFFVWLASKLPRQQLTVTSSEWIYTPTTGTTQRQDLKRLKRVEYIPKSWGGRGSQNPVGGILKFEASPDFDVELNKGLIEAARPSLESRITKAEHPVGYRPVCSDPTFILGPSFSRGTKRMVRPCQHVGFAAVGMLRLEAVH